MKIVWKNSKGNIVAEVKKLQAFSSMGLHETWTYQVYHGSQGYYGECKYPSDAQKKVEDLIVKLKYNDVYREDPKQ